MDAWGRFRNEKGIEKISYSGAELDAFRNKVAGPAAASWIEDNAKRGLPAQELYKLVTGLIAETAQ